MALGRCWLLGLVAAARSPPGPVSREWNTRESHTCKLCTVLYCTPVHLNTRESHTKARSEHDTRSQILSPLHSPLCGISGLCLTLDNSNEIFAKEKLTIAMVTTAVQRRG